MSDKLNWPQTNIGMDSEIRVDYGVTGAPYYFVIGPDGKTSSTSRDWNEIKAAVAALGTTMN